MEDLLREAKQNGGTVGPPDGEDGTSSPDVPIPSIAYDEIGIDFEEDAIGDEKGGAADRFPPQQSQPLGADVPDFMPFDLISMGMYETLPPQEVMEDLNKSYFQRQHNYMPIIHPGSYLKSFYSPPHMKPPMCLQYALWAVASNGHEKYHLYHDVFYQRARRYAEADELKGFGEFFITVQHAQAWALIATDEARSMYFTRAAMSSAKCTKLVHMMGLHRLDAPPEEMAPTLAPPRNWIELEERRRIFWGAFCTDSHGTIATGWPTMHDWTEISTHLPSSEEAFNRGEEQESCTLEDAFNGATYGPFAGAVIICHIFSRILHHVHRERPGDRAQDERFGKFWKRHRELDNLLSSAFMHLPEIYRLPRNLHNPAAVHTNLNLHASIICLHHAALERIEIHKLPDNLRQMSVTRMKMAASEIVHIIKLTSHQHPAYRSPLVALSLYCATSFHIFQAREVFSPSSSQSPVTLSPDTGSSPRSTNQGTPGSFTPPSAPSTTPNRTNKTDALPQYDFSNIELLLSAMEAIGREHVITRAFLRQALLDLDRNNLTGPAQASGMRFPRNEIINALSSSSANIPLLARSSVSKHTSIQPPLPGRLPLNAPIGEKPLMKSCLGFDKNACPLDGLPDSAKEPEFLVTSDEDHAASCANVDSTKKGTKRRRIDNTDDRSGFQAPTNTLFADPPPNGLSRIEHLFHNAANTSRISPMPFVTATATNRPHPQPGRPQVSPPGFAARNPVYAAINQKPVLAGPTPLPFRRAMQPEYGQVSSPSLEAPTNQSAPNGAEIDPPAIVNGGTQKPPAVHRGQDSNQCPEFINADNNPFGIIAEGAVDVDSLLNDLGHGTVVGIADGTVPISATSQEFVHAMANSQIMTEGGTSVSGTGVGVSDGGVHNPQGLVLSDTSWNQMMVSGTIENMLGANLNLGLLGGITQGETTRDTAVEGNTSGRPPQQPDHREQDIFVTGDPWAMLDSNDHNDMWGSEFVGMDRTG